MKDSAKKRKCRWKIPFFKLWIVKDRELARTDSKIAILEAKYKNQLVREKIRTDQDAGFLKSLAGTSRDKALIKFQRENFMLKQEIQYLRRSKS